MKNIEFPILNAYLQYDEEIIRLGNLVFHLSLLKRKQFQNLFSNFHRRLYNFFTIGVNPNIL